MLTLLIAGLAAGSIPTPLNKPTWAESRPGLDGTRIEMVIDAAGEAVGCAAVDPAARPVGDICAQAKARARFKPARDDSGVKIAGVYRFIIGNTPQPPEIVMSVSRAPAGGVSSATVRFVTGSSGAVESCVVDRTSGVSRLDAAACSSVTRTRFAPVRDETGSPVRAARAVEVGFAAAPAPPPPN